MTYTSKEINSKIIDVHINNLNNIQSIISRLSNIGITLFSIAITVFSILISIIYSLNIPILIRLILSISLLFIILCFFISHSINLKNEKLWINIYIDKCNIDILSLNSKNIISDILKIDFIKYKKDKKIKLLDLIKSWWSFCWLIMILFILVTIIIIFFLY